MLVAPLVSAIGCRSGAKYNTYGRHRPMQSDRGLWCLQVKPMRWVRFDRFLDAGDLVAAFSRLADR